MTKPEAPTGVPLPRSADRKLVPIDRKRSSVVAPESGLKVEMETVAEGAYRGLSLSFEEFAPGAADVLPFAPRRKTRG